MTNNKQRLELVEIDDRVVVIGWNFVITVLNDNNVVTLTVTIKMIRIK